MEPQRNILYVEDDPLDADLLIRHLAEKASHLSIIHVDTAQACLNLVVEKTFDLILLDNNLPDILGIDMLKKLIMMQNRTPVIMITGQGDEYLAINSLRIGATDYICKKGNYLEKLPEIIEANIRGSAVSGKRQMNMTVTQHNILYIEKNKADIDLTIQYFRDHAPQISVIIAETTYDGLELLLGENQTDLILMDLWMNDQNALEFLKELKLRNIDTPLIVVTGKGDEDHAVTAIHLGAYDYIVKRENYLTRLPYAIYNAIDKFTTDKLNRELRMKLDNRVEELEKLTMELEAFTHYISSGFGVPLRAIEGFSRILEKNYSERLDKEGGRLIDIIRQNAKKLDAMLHDLFNLSQVSHSNLKISKINMAFMVRTLYKQIATGKDKETVTFTVAQLPLAMGFAPLIKMVWSNLLVNALKFTKSKKNPEIQIGYRQESAELVFWVKDNGVGFDPKLSEKLFNIFQRLHNDPDFEGTGVGLAIVRRVVHLHGGSVWAEGEVDRGATFYFSLPVQPALIPAKPQPAIL